MPQDRMLSSRFCSGGFAVVLVFAIHLRCAAAEAELSPDLHPTASATEGDDWGAYIFGYGSLVSKASAASTLCPGIPAIDCRSAQEFIPVRVAGYKRGFFLGLASNPKSPFAFLNTPEWSKQQLLRSFQVLTIEHASPEDTVNGVIFPVTLAQKEAIFRREMGYQHEQVAWDDVTILSDKSHANAHEGMPIYTDVTGNEFHSEPTAASPLAQTYVDLLLGGALEIDKRDDMPGNFSFTDEVIDTTFGWSRHWVNDRPNLFRPMVDSPMAFEVDIYLLLNCTRMHQYIKHITLADNFQTSSPPAPWIHLALAAVAPLLALSVLHGARRCIRRWSSISELRHQRCCRACGQAGSYTPLKSEEQDGSDQSRTSSVTAIV